MRIIFELHECPRGPVCLQQHDMGLNSAGQRVVVDEPCGHESCQRISDGVAVCGRCMSDGIAEEELFGEVEKALETKEDNDDG